MPVLRKLSHGLPWTKNRHRGGAAAAEPAGEEKKEEEKEEGAYLAPKIAIVSTMWLISLQRRRNQTRTWALAFSTKHSRWLFLFVFAWSIQRRGGCNLSRFMGYEKSIQNHFKFYRFIRSS